jgi:hypothetical protein
MRQHEKEEIAFEKAGDNDFFVIDRLGSNTQR